MDVVDHVYQMLLRARCNASRSSFQQLEGYFELQNPNFVSNMSMGDVPNKYG